MSKTSSEAASQYDALSLLLRQIGFSARVFFREGYCGHWAIDTSGSAQVPFHLVCQGEGWLHGDTQTPQKLVAGQLVMFPQDQPHILAASPTPPNLEDLNKPPPERMSGDITRLVCGYFEFDQRIAAPMLNSLPSTMILDLSDAGDSTTRDLVNLWMREAAQTTLGSDLAVDRLAELVFMQMLRTEIANDRIRGVIGALGDPKLGDVLARIHRSPAHEHSLTELAKEANLSESAFAQRFKSRVGMTPGQYVIQWRMQTAARALINDQASITEIAADSGYESEAAFRKAFRSHFDIAPGAYRRRYKASGT